MKKKLLATIAVTLGLSLIVLINIPTSTKANSNVLLASVEWVQAQLNPLQTKVTALEKQVAEQEQAIKQLQKAVAEGGGVVNPPTNPPTTNPGTPQDLPTVVYTTANNVKVHSGASRNYKVLATLGTGKGVTVIDQHKAAAGVWYRVEVSASVKGWVFAEDVSTTKPGSYVPSQVVTKGAVNVRKGATTNYNSLELVAKGSTLKYLGSFKNASGETWYNVQTPKGTKGWVLSTLTEVK